MLASWKDLRHLVLPSIEKVLSRKERMRYDDAYKTGMIKSCHMRHSRQIARSLLNTNVKLAMVTIGGDPYSGVDTLQWSIPKIS